jgi:hypothetical protein
MQNLFERASLLPVMTKHTVNESKRKKCLLELQCISTTIKVICNIAYALIILHTYTYTLTHTHEHTHTSTNTNLHSYLAQSDNKTLT